MKYLIINLKNKKMNIKYQHLIIIIDDENKIEPKKYCCNFEDKTKEDAISISKKQYEKQYNNFTYKSYYFKHQTP